MENINIKVRIYSSIFVAFLVSHLVMKIIAAGPEKILTQLQTSFPITTNQQLTPTTTSTNNPSGTVFTIVVPTIDQAINNITQQQPTPTPRPPITNPSVTPFINIPTQIKPSPTKTPIPTNKPSPTIKPSPTPTKKPTLAPTPAGACPAMNTGLPNSTMYYPNGSTSIPATTKEICAYSGSQYQSVPYRNPNCLATQNGIRKAYERMKSYYPNYWQASKLLKDWQTVQTYAKKYNFNPLFVISVWIEESAAGGATAATQLGCDYRLNKDSSFTRMSASSSICEQMECFFGRRSVAPTNYGSWACQYQHGSSQWVNNQCLKVTTFTKGIEFWYNYMAENLPLNCQIRFFSPADSRCN